MSESKTVLIADDEPANRELLRSLLEVYDYQVLESVDGRSTLEMVRESSPDLVLLDIMMPAPDGFEVCETLKKDRTTEPIPILLVTALSDRKSRLRGIKAGANDFITKPIDTADTVLRVRNALRMKELHDLAQSRFETLQETEAMRQEMVNMLVHDFKTPLTAVLGYTKLLKYQMDDSTTQEQRRFLDCAIESATRLERMISSTLDVSKMREKAQALNLATVEPSTILQGAVDTLQATATLREVKISTEVENDSPILCDPSLIRRVLENLCDNALRYASPEHGELKLRVTDAGELIRFEVKDNGAGIPSHRLQEVFGKFSTTGVQGVSHGLGLTFCREAVQMHGGQIHVESEEGEGSSFIFHIPARRDQVDSD